MVICGNCQGENRENARFCRMCGAALAVETPIEPTPVPPVEAAPTAETPEELVETVLELQAAEPPAESVSMLEEPQTPELAEPLAEPAPIPEQAPKQELVSENLSASLEQRLEEAQQVEMESLPAEFLMNGRFHLVRLVSAGPDGSVYEAEDGLRCWVCQTVQSDPEPNFCEMCGAQLTQKPAVHLRTVAAGELLPEGAESFIENGVTYVVELPQPTSLQEKKAVRVRFHTGYQSDVGRQRDLDEDSLLVMQLNALCEMKNAPALGFFAVADGIGGHDAGEVASRTAIQALAAAVLERIFAAVIRQPDLSFEELTAALVAAIQEANQAILSLRQQSQVDINLGCTLTAAVLRDTTAVVANVGDSRTYRMHNGVLSKVTNDHSVVARLVERNLIRPEDIYTHEQKGVIYRSLGDKPALEVDTFQLELELGDRLVLCCDGVWEMVRDPYIEDVLLELYDPQQACDRLVQQANLAGGEDNISVIIVNLEELAWMSD